MYIALSDKLLLEFLSYNGLGSFDKQLISKLFKYLHPFKIGKYQLPLIDASIAKQLLPGNDFISTSSATTKDDLINDTLFKIMLTDDTTTYPYIDIMNDEIEINFNATYKSRIDRTKAQEHIKSLLKNSNKVSIYDKYFLKHWNSNSKLFKDSSNNSILMNGVNLIIYVDFDATNDMAFQLAEQELNVIANNSKIEKYNDSKMHDRYIETDKLRIILTSGLDYLENRRKDFTYIIKEK